MTLPLKRKDMSLRALELFQLVAKRGSLKAVAEETGTSISTVSHHLKGLEDSMGVALLNHTRRPLTLTATGENFLAKIEDALLAIRKAKAEATTGDSIGPRLLRVGSIEDLDSDIIPELVVFLSKRLPNCDLVFQSDRSMQIIDAVRQHQLDIGICSQSAEKTTDLHEIPLLKDPFVLLTPIDHETDADQVFHAASSLPFIRFPSNQIIARQIEAQLSRMGHRFPRRFESGNSQTQMAMVAAGAGWSISTPLLFARGQRFHDRVRMRPIPGKAFSRNLSIYSAPDCPSPIRDLVSQRLRMLIDDVVLSRMHKSHPWLKESFRLL